MKNVIATAAAALFVFAGAAVAAPSQIDLNKIQAFAPTADVTVLSDKAVAQLVATIHSGNSAGEVANAIKSALSAAK